MSADALLVGIARYLHVIAAALAVGSLFFMRIILPRAIDHLDPAAREEVFLRARRIFKRLIHTCVLVLLLSGIYNSIRLFPQYSAARGVLHGLWGMHMLIGLIVIGISLWLLAGQNPPANHRTWGLVNIVLIFVLIALGSAVKTARERLNANPKSAPAQATP